MVITVAPLVAIASQYLSLVSPGPTAEWPRSLSYLSGGSLVSPGPRASQESDFSVLRWTKGRQLSLLVSGQKLSSGLRAEVGWVGLVSSSVNAERLLKFQSSEKRSQGRDKEL